MQRDAMNLDAVTTAAQCLGGLLRPGHVLLLGGTMGAGKTTFTRALAAGLGVARPDRVCSPTFNICIVHRGPIPLVHIDLFRLAPDDSVGVAPASFEALGLQDRLDAVGDAVGQDLRDDADAGVVVVEWPSLGRFDAPEALDIELRRADGAPEHRDLRVEARGPRHRELLEAWSAVTA